MIDDEKPQLGDRLTGAKLIIAALEARELDAEQAERLLDSLIPRAEPAPTTISPQRPLEGPLSDLDETDAREQAERRPIPRDERQEAIDAELARLAAPVEPVTPGTNLLEEPDEFVQRVARARANKQTTGTPHR
jgi:hypothetical protein